LGALDRLFWAKLYSGFTIFNQKTQDGKKGREEKQRNMQCPVLQRIPLPKCEFHKQSPTFGAEKGALLLSFWLSFSGLSGHNREQKKMAKKTNSKQFRGRQGGSTTPNTIKFRGEGGLAWPGLAVCAWQSVTPTCLTPPYIPDQDNQFNTALSPARGCAVFKRCAHSASPRFGFAGLRGPPWGLVGGLVVEGWWLRVGGLLGGSWGARGGS
jgi:hypothetical protein